MSLFNDDETNQNKIVYVGRLPTSTTSALLESYFIPFGPISRIALPTDSKTSKIRGHAFIEFEFETDARHAVENMNDCEIDHNVIRCSLASQGMSAKAAWSSSIGNTDDTTLDEGQAITI